MKPEEKLVAQLEQLSKDTGVKHLNHMWVTFLQSPETRLNMQKGLLALSFGFHRAGKEDGAQHFYEAAGYIEGLNEKIKESS